MTAFSKAILYTLHTSCGSSNSKNSPPSPKPTPQEAHLWEGSLLESTVLTSLPASFCEQMELPTSFMLQVMWKISCRSPSRPSRVLHESSLQKSCKGEDYQTLSAQRLPLQAHFPLSLPKFPVSHEWEEGCQWAFLVWRKILRSLEKIY